MGWCLYPNTSSIRFESCKDHKIIKMKFKIYYDDQPNEVVDRISSILKNFNINVEDLNGGDGFMEYDITEIKDDNESI